MDRVERTPAMLILSGGLGLGAYQLGAYEALAERLDIAAVAGSSIGAFNGAIIAGNPPERRLERLRAFWAANVTELVPGMLPPLMPVGGPFRHLQNWANTLAARLGGARALFHPRPGLGLGDEVPSFYDSARASAALTGLVDFDRLNAGGTRFCVAATDIETGALVTFDTAAGDRIGIDHLLASGGLLPSFAPVRIDGRLLGDGGFAANAPLEPFLASDRQGALPPLAVLIDLFAPDGPVPRRIETAAERATDLKWATQTLLRLQGLVRERALEARWRDDPGTTLLHLSYRPRSEEAGSEKPYDFSAASLRDRAAAGHADAQAALARLDAIEHPGTPGLHVHPIRRPETA